MQGPIGFARLLAILSISSFLFSCRDSGSNPDEARTNPISITSDLAEKCFVDARIGYAEIPSTATIGSIHARIGGEGVSDSGYLLVPLRFNSFDE